ncbi:hypothetical protein PCC7418_2478 [Halothece sp. PCC 7418]|uniref:hypothetical protein n=1 Tax=Halothece sp. (strain PCC 7418) TaxID=65093 RepID=UPI0002A068F8|nr:hypothetical protein [Halothece sp. PCC 7418]AFZ44625.1 hypothetical protein PCC7418_2478 [Halothece sp. PCC 7418]
MTGFIVLTLRLLLGILTLKIFVRLDPVASFINQGYQAILRDPSTHFFMVFGEEFLIFLLPLIFYYQLSLIRLIENLIKIP